MLGAGSSLIGKSLKTEILREEALELALEGFLPVQRARREARRRKSAACSANSVCRTSPIRPSRGTSNAFLERRAGARRDPVQRRLLHPGDLPAARGRRGGALVRQAPGDFREPRPGPGGGRGAAYYSYVRSTGSGVLVRGGLPRTYYIGIGGADGDGKFGRVPGAARRRGRRRRSRSISDALQLVANRPVSFRLYSSLTRTEDKLGEVVEFAAGRRRTCTCTRR